jgi:hypothetical protein
MQTAIGCILCLVSYSCTQCSRKAADERKVCRIGLRNTGTVVSQSQVST